MPPVFQYGSNCDAERLNVPERLAGDARDLGRAETIEEFDIAFDVWSQTNGCAASNLIRVPCSGRRAWGILFEIPAVLIRGRRTDDRKTLAQIEDPRYEEKQIRIRNAAGEELEVATFLVRPEEQRPGLWTSFEYVQHIVNGLRAHEVPDEYVERVIDIAVRTNNFAAQSARDQVRLIEQLRRPTIRQNSLPRDTSFRFASYRDFKRSLGKINAANECTELAIRSFIDGARKAPSADAYIQQLSEVYKVKVDAVDLDALSAQIGQYHVISVHQQFELFLREFRSEHPNSKWEKVEGDDLLKSTLKSIGGGFAATAALIGRLEVDVADYYRLIRNRFVHALEERAVPVRAEDLRSRVRESEKYARLTAPNEYGAVGFDDFVLFARVSKQIALQLCKVARPTDQEITDMLTQNVDQKRSVNEIVRRFRKEPERLHNALATFLRSSFSLERQESEPIINIILGSLA